MQTMIAAAVLASLASSQALESIQKRSMGTLQSGRVFEAGAYWHGDGQPSCDTQVYQMVPGKCLNWNDISFFVRSRGADCDAGSYHGYDVLYYMAANCTGLYTEYRLPSNECVVIGKMTIQFLVGGMSGDVYCALASYHGTQSTATGSRYFYSAPGCNTTALSGGSFSINDQYDSFPDNVIPAGSNSGGNSDSGNSSCRERCNGTCCSKPLRDSSTCIIERYQKQVFTCAAGVVYHVVEGFGSTDDTCATSLTQGITIYDNSCRFDFTGYYKANVTQDARHAICSIVQTGALGEHFLSPSRVRSEMPWSIDTIPDLPALSSAHATTASLSLLFVFAAITTFLC